MTYLHSIARLHLAALSDRRRLCRVASRLCLLLTAILLAVSPWTEYHCDWDRFLRDGQDLEFGLLAVALVLCLVLLLSQRGCQGLVAFLAGLCARFLLLRPPGRVAVFQTVSKPLSRSCPGHAIYSHPIQV